MNTIELWDRWSKEIIPTMKSHFIVDVKPNNNIKAIVVSKGVLMWPAIYYGGTVIEIAPLRETKQVTQHHNKKFYTFATWESHNNIIHVFIPISGCAGMISAIDYHGIFVGVK